jgi:hypothetical protein
MRNKSNNAKNRFAIISAAAITLLVMLLWFLIIKNEQGDETAKLNSTADDLKPLFLIFKDAKEGFNEIKESRQRAKANAVESRENGTSVIE